MFKNNNSSGKPNTVILKKKLNIIQDIVIHPNELIRDDEVFFQGEVPLPLIHYVENEEQNDNFDEIIRNLELTENIQEAEHIQEHSDNNQEAEPIQVNVEHFQSAEQVQVNVELIQEDPDQIYEQEVEETDIVDDRSSRFKKYSENVTRINYQISQVKKEENQFREKVSDCVEFIELLKERKRKLMGLFENQNKQDSLIKKLKFNF